MGGFVSGLALIPQTVEARAAHGFKERIVAAGSASGTRRELRRFA